ncbi:cytochrome c [Paenibacillus sp. J2TS4]|uniref:c-type cytochrome n=1 Tax=Paenibacillus sp. J2TS4 TaxID=2807194 RepID=UPI001B145CC0|nr:cytochrome c [Paenibacillus sp. J2TS4]GIP34758.1 hypothetical protein J2TS4_39680 [Paenibacillus sp. J2TS4]
MKKAMVIFFCLFLITALAACGSKKDNAGTASPSPGAPSGEPGKQPATTVDAEALYKQHCLACHGANLEGKLGGNTNLTKVGGKLSKEQIVTKIENGGNGMTAFKNTLNSDQINALADWLSTKK